MFINDNKITDIKICKTIKINKLWQQELKKNK